MKPFSQKGIGLSDKEIFAALNLSGNIAGISGDIEGSDFHSASLNWASYITEREHRQLPQHHIIERVSDRTIIEEADYAFEHKAKVSGTRRIDLGEEINFISSTRDHFLEEIHSLAFLLYLAGAYRITNAPKYAAAFETILNKWFAQHQKVPPSEIHPVWNDSSCGIRVIAIADCYFTLISSGIFKPEFHKMILHIFLSSARWLYDSLAEYREGDTVFDACAGLVIIGTLFPEFQESPEWLNRATKCIIEKASREFTKEGSYCAMSDIIGVKVLDRLIFISLLLTQHKLECLLPKNFSKMLMAYAEFFVKTCTPACTTNSFNNSAYVMLASRFQEWTQLFSRYDFLYPLREFMPEPVRKMAKLPGWGPSLNLPASGRCIMRDGWDKSCPYMAVEYSPADRYSHYETTDFAIFAFGKPMVIDRGMGSTPDDPYHFFLRTSRLHSMVTIADENIDMKAKHAGVNAWFSGKQYDFLALEHSGYKKKFEALVTRAILFVKPHYWIISDAVLNPKKTVKATSYIHTLPVLFVEEDGSIYCRQAPGIDIAYPCSDKIEFIKERAVANLSAFQSEMEWTDYIGFRKSAKINKGTTFMMLICPYELTPPKISISRLDVLPAKGKAMVEPTVAEAFEISMPDAKAIFFITHGKPAVRRFGSIATDSACGIVSFSALGEAVSYFAADAKMLELDGKHLHKSGKPVTIEKTLNVRKK